ncbi:MAG: archaeosortase/exosortase family protein [Myxococcota bacterium]
MRERAVPDPRAPDSRGSRRTRLWTDLGVAAAVGAAFALSPLTSVTRTLPSLAGGCLAGLAVFAIRARGSGPSLARPRTAPVPRLALLLPALFALLFAPTLASLYGWYTESIWRNAHGLFVPLLMVGLAASVLRRERGGPAESSAWGFAPLLAGLVLVVLDSGVRTLYLGTLGFVLALAGASLLLLGARRTRRLALPISLGLFLLPLPAALSIYLKLPVASAAGTQLFLELFGLPVLREGTVLVMAHNVFGISVRCAGFAIVYAGLGLALVLGVYARSRTRALLLLLAVWPLTWLANSLRTALLILFSEARGIEALEGPLHTVSGIAAFGGVMVALFLMADHRGLRKALS